MKSFIFALGLIAIFASQAAQANTFECVNGDRNKIEGVASNAADGDIMSVEISKFFVAHPQDRYLDIVVSSAVFEYERDSRRCGKSDLGLQKNCFLSEYVSQVRLGTIFGASAGRSGSFQWDVDVRYSTSGKFKTLTFQCAMYR